MKKILIAYFTVIFCFTFSVVAQVTDDDTKTVQVFDSVKGLRESFIQIMKSEDELRFDKVLENLLKSPNPTERTRAALAAGRIGDEKAIPFLVEMTENDRSAKAREMAVFALGEIESIKGTDAVLAVLKNKGFPDIIRARAAESAGKIAAANAKDEKSKELGKAILDILEDEDKRASKQSKEIILLGITAALRAKADETDKTVGKFLTNSDARIRADAANALARLRTKNSNETFRAMLLNDKDAIARANAARGLGAGEDKEAVEILTKSAVSDEDSRVRVSAIRSLGSLKDAKSAEKLLESGKKLLADYKNSKFSNPFEKNEFLEIANALGNINSETGKGKAIGFLNEFDKLDKYQSPEISIALTRLAPKTMFSDEKKIALKTNWKVLSSVSQGISEIAKLEKTDANEEFKNEIENELNKMIKDALVPENKAALSKVAMSPAISDLLRTYAAFEPENLDENLREFLLKRDIFIRATAGELLGEQTATKENTEALKTAFSSSLKTDKIYNDAQLAILSALVKLDKQESIETLKIALDAPDYLVRKHAANLIKQNNLTKDFPNLEEKVGTVKVYNPKTGTKLGQILNTEADYRRAAMRKNGTVKAILTTEKGKFTIELLPEDAPLTVDNFIKLARSRYFNGLAVHRVVPNFVMQDGDPRGDGNGGPGWSIRDEMNAVPFERGAVGMALSGKDTGGSQWFVTHSPQPHLDGGYTVFGHVNETGMKIVDTIVRGDKILKVEIIEKK